VLFQACKVNPMSVRDGASERRPRTREQRRAQTRRRIVEAAVELHSTIGPARTSYSAVARRAGVTRPTLYAYFPDKQSLFAACSGHANAIDPVPDPVRWAAVGDPIERLRGFLSDLYAYYRRNAERIANLERDMPLMQMSAPPGRTIEGDRRRTMETFVADLSRSDPPSERVIAVVRHAFAFATWRSLTQRPGVSDEEAIELMVGLIESARPPRGSTARATTRARSN
jgi:AcrR family transcriptional regulator